MKNEKEILIIDDDNKNIFALSAVLKARKYNCIAALSAGEGLEMLAENKNISVVLMDMM
nr:response regulator [Chryseobacterium sp.]